MGGSIDVVSSALDLLSGVADSGEKSTPSQESGQLKAECEAQEAEQSQKEAAERKRLRDNVTEARERQRKRKEDEDTAGQTTLLHGGAGLTDDPQVSRRQLKSKFGE